MRMLLLRSCYPSGQVKRATLVFICQSQLPFISGSNLTAREPFSITEHWKPADPQSRPPVHAPQSLHLCKSKQLNKTPPRFYRMYTSYQMLKTAFSLLSNYSSNDGKSITFSLRSACQDVSPEFQFLCTHPNPKQHTYTSFFSPWPMSAPCWHWLTIYLFLACRLVSLSVVTGVAQLSKWCKNRLKIECSFNCWTGLHQFFFLSVELRCMLWDQLLHERDSGRAAALVPWLF